MWFVAFRDRVGIQSTSVHLRPGACLKFCAYGMPWEEGACMPGTALTFQSRGYLRRDITRPDPRPVRLRWQEV